jgi:Amt family ammonium transporter
METARIAPGEHAVKPAPRETGRSWRLASWPVLAAALAVLLSGGSAGAEEAAANSGHTAWMLTSTALVLFMTIPGLALFYGGLVRSRNVLSVLMQCFACTALITILWVLYGYTLAFDTTGMDKGVVNFNSFLGTFQKLFMGGVKVGSVTNGIPETVFSMFQLTFAIITPALIVGAFAERMKFSACLWFIGLWFTLVYLPICHMVWAGDGSYMGGHLGVLDFAGGTVVHINAGIAALVAALMIGKRKGYPQTPMPPHNLTMTVTGACMLWVGWFGFNAGSAVAADGSAGMAMIVTQIATAAATLTWMTIEWVRNGKPSALGTATGAVAGLVAITPASGTCGPMGAIAIGVIAAVCCFLGATVLKRKFGYDDALDAFGVHGVGGFTGAILTGLFASETFGGQKEGLNIANQVGYQFLGSCITIAYGAAVSYVILRVLDGTLGLRVSEAEETEGLDLSLHEERGYNI